MKLGVLGGTFDPVHTGHIKMAEAARAALELSRVILVPAGQPLLKPPHPITPAEHRLKMLYLAIADRPYFQISTIELDRPGPSYTVDTIAALGAQYGSGAEIYFVLGMDSLAMINEWREPARLVSLCRLVAIPRPGYRRPNLQVLEADVPGISRRVVFLKKPRVNISASVIRGMAVQGVSLSRLVPGPVAEYIRQHHLYATP